MILRPVRGAGDLAAARALFAERAAALANEIGPQDVDAELASLPGDYAPPTGELLIAWSAAGQPLGIIGIRSCPVPGRSEIKRLFVRPQARGTGSGRALATAALALAAAVGQEAVLDTLPSMGSAIALYRSLGFRPIPPYWDSPLPGTMYFGLTLREGG